MPSCAAVGHGLYAMHPIVVWLGIYVFLLWALRLVVGTWRDQLWFRCVFAPAMIVTALVLRPLGRLCFGKRSRVRPLESGVRAVAVEGERVPCLAGALWLVLTHLIVYILFISAASQIATFTGLGVDTVVLPEIDVDELFLGRIELDWNDSIEGLQAFAGQGAIPTLGLIAIAWLGASFFCALGPSMDQGIWALLVLVLFGLSSRVARWFGLGFPFLSRGWFAEFFFFPSCWSLFALFCTVLLGTLVCASGARLVALGFAALRPRKEPAPQAAPRRALEKVRT